MPLEKLGEGEGYSKCSFAINAEWDTEKEQIESISKANEGLFIRTKENDQIDSF